MANSLKYATLSAGSRWLIGVETGTGAGRIASGDLEEGEKHAFTEIRNRLNRAFDIATWFTNPPVEVAQAAEALGAAFVIKFRAAQGGSTGKGDPPWKPAEDYAEAKLKAIETAQKVTFSDNSEQLAKRARSPVVHNAGATFFPDSAVREIAR